MRAASQFVVGVTPMTAPAAAARYCQPGDSSGLCTVGSSRTQRARETLGT